jgi:hypothetical protein
MNGSLYSVGALGDTRDPRAKREIEKLLDDQFKRVKHLLVEYREAADELVDRLVDNAGSCFSLLAFKTPSVEAQQSQAQGPVALATLGSPVDLALMRRNGAANPGCRESRGTVSSPKTIDVSVHGDILHIQGETKHDDSCPACLFGRKVNAGVVH